MKKHKRKKQSFAGKVVFGFFKVIFIAIFSVIKYFFLGLFWSLKKVFKKSVKSKKEELNDDSKTEKKSVKTKSEKGIKLPAVFSDFVSSEIIKGNIDDFNSRLLSNSLILTIVGKRGSGKSALGFRILENIYAKNQRPCFALGVKQSALPVWIKSIDSIDEVDNKGVLLVDEGAVSFSSRKSMSKENKELSNLLAIARHKDLTLILITQNTGMIDKNVLNLTDSVLVKEGSLLQQKMERSVMKDFYETAEKHFNKLLQSERNAYFYLFDSSVEGFVSSSLPSFWSDNVSKSRKS